DAERILREFTAHTNADRLRQLRAPGFGGSHAGRTACYWWYWAKIPRDQSRAVARVRRAGISRPSARSTRFPVLTLSSGAVAIFSHSAVRPAGLGDQAGF